MRFNLRDDLGFTDEDLANMTTLIQLRLRNISGEDTLYIDEIRLLKLEEAEPVDKTYLEAAIQNAVELKGSILVGTEPGQAPQEAHDDSKQRLTLLRQFMTIPMLPKTKEMLKSMR